HSYLRNTFTGLPSFGGATPLGAPQRMRPRGPGFLPAYWHKESLGDFREKKGDCEERNNLTGCRYSSYLIDFVTYQQHPTYKPSQKDIFQKDFEMRNRRASAAVAQRTH